MADEIPDEDRVALGTYVGVGCLTSIAGFFGGGMIAVLVAKVVGSFRNCQPPDGLPACDWEKYMIVGALIGVVGLPLVSIFRLRGRRA